MGILDKIMFWKKKDEFADVGLGEKENMPFGNEFGDAPGTGLGPSPGLGSEPRGQGLGQQPSPSYPTQGPSMPPPSYPSQPQFQPQPPSYTPQQDLESKNLEIISSKLDALRASIDSLNQRLANLEAIARGEEQGKRRRYY
jgi:hypothetical protein|tara:strand:+ start:12119 stop:12541 length:423 start_codon:yes stop_codon:yes gene_type:complete